MKGYSNNRAHKGRVAYRTPSRWLAGRPEVFKRQPDSKLHRKLRGNSSWLNNDNNP